MVSIILLSHNKWEVTKACIESIRQNVTIPFEIIVVDNASDSQTVRELQAIADIRLIRNPVNMGFPAGCNTGLRAARGDLIWFLNNDTIVPPGSLERMAELLLSDGKIGMVGPLTNNITGIQRIPVPYDDKREHFDSTDEISAFARQLQRQNAGSARRVIRLLGFSLLVKKTVLDEVGGFDERMGIGTFEDDDLTLRVAAAGYRLFIARDAFIHHIGNVSFKAAGGYPPIGDKNQRTVSSTFEMTLPDEVIPNEELLRRLSPEPTVLHIECGAGAFGLRMQEERRYVAGLESSEKKARIAKAYYNTLTLYEPGADVSLPAADGFFGALAMERQYSSPLTLSVLRSVRPKLKPGAQVLIDVPRLTGKVADGVYETYLDRWSSATGHYPQRGVFNLRAFTEAMRELHFRLTDSSITDLRRGFYNRCAFSRHRESAREKATDFDFFKGLILEFRMQ